MRYTDFKLVERKQKTGSAGQAKGKDTMPKATPGRKKHPLQDKLVGEAIVNEAEARIQHAEDLVFFQGSAGAARAIESLKSLEQGSHTDVTIKWDGSPAVIFGRDVDGNFVFTDKSGFSAKGYDGKAKSAKELAQMLKNRPGYAKNPEGYGPFIANMVDVYDEYEKAVPKDYRGFFKGDLLYFNTPEIQDGHYVFTPNIVTYSVKQNSEVGKRIGMSKSGIVIHREADIAGTETPLRDTNIFQGTEVLVLPPVVAQEAPSVDDSQIKELQAIVTKHGRAIDSIIERRQGLSDLSNIFYTYMNSRVDSGIKNLAQDFAGWLATSKVSKPKQQKIIEIINNNVDGFNAMWNLVYGIMKVKDNIINQLENQEADITANIKGEQGGEGYVLAHPGGDIKLVPREFFTKHNRAVER